MKKCTGKCGKTKPLSEFGKHRDKKGGLQSWCKVCCAEYARQYRKDNPDKIKTLNVQQYQDNRDERLAYQNQYYKDNRDAVLTQRKQYYQDNHDEKLTYQNNRKTELKQNGLCTSCGQYPTIEHSATLCEICYFKDKSYQALGTIEHWMYVGWLFEAQHHKCALTGEPLVLGKNTSIDHIASRKTHPELITDPNNIQWVTFSANARKKNMTNEEALKKLAISV